MYLDLLDELNHTGYNRVQSANYSGRGGGGLYKLWEPCPPPPPLIFFYTPDWIKQSKKQTNKQKKLMILLY